MNNRRKLALLREVDRFLAMGCALFPLKPGRKDPLETGWPTKEYSKKQLYEFVNKRGCNIGWRLGPLDLVIDVDPRHVGAAEAERKLTEKWGAENLTKICPTVHTGGVDRGHHYYTKLPRSVKLKTVLPIFDGIDFRRQGHYVLIPGCIHPETKRAYHWDLFCPSEPPEIPQWLFELLRIDIEPARSTEETESSLSLQEIKGLLDRIPATNYQDYDDWLKIGMAVHAACEGDPAGAELFVEWSLTDPAYSDAEQSARAKWASYDESRENGITAATLVAAAMLDGGPPSGVPAVVAFAEPVERALSMLPLGQFKRLLSTDKRPPLVTAVELACRFGVEHWEELRENIKLAYRARLASIDNIAVSYRRKQRKAKTQKQKQVERRQSKNPKLVILSDPAIQVANHLLEKHFEGGRLLIHAKNQRFYEYTGTHWEILPANEVDRLVLRSALAVKVDSKGKAKFRASSLFTACERVLVALTARRKDVFDFRGGPKPVVNTQTAEVWINSDGTHTIKNHSPESYLMTCLDTTFEEGAECPVFTRTLEEIFQDNESPQNMIRHLFEFMGYVMQPHKNIPTWWMFQGDGSNGKTFVFNVFQKLLGTAVLPWPIEKFADDGRNNHATASLVGKLLVMDDDAKVDAFLPESALKKLAERKLFEANPKKLDAFTFMSCATPVMLINDWPRIRDLSWGLIRKAYLLPFKRTFGKGEADLNREPYVIENELPGILNEALKGYNRLRSRGQFDEPDECVEAKNKWLKAANPLIEYCATEIKKTGNGVAVPLAEVYQSYLIWCHNLGGVRYPAAKNRFELSLKQLGYRIGRAKNEPALLGATLKGSPEDVFN